MFSKISFHSVWETLKNAHLGYLILGLFFLAFSQWISADRLLTFFKKDGFYLSSKSNLKLYALGMFYNFFIPGGIGGDAYKVFILNKEFKWSVKKLTSAVFVDRFMGLTAIGILIFIGSFFLNIESIKIHRYWLSPLVIILTLAISFLFVKKLFKKYVPIYNKTLWQSLFVQLLQCASIVSLLLSVSGNTNNYLIYVLTFLVSSVLSLISFSGIGIREWFFLQVATFLVFDETIAVTIGALFSILTAVISSLGIFFQIKKQQLKLQN